MVGPKLGPESNKNVQKGQNSLNDPGNEILRFKSNFKY